MPAPTAAPHRPDAVTPSGATARVRARDRGWLGLDSVRVFGPFAGLDAAGLRAALTAMHAAQPAHPAVCRLDPATARWRRLSTAEFPAHADRCVVALPDDGDPADAVARHLLGTPADGRTVVLAVCQGFAGFKVSHVVGDGRVVNTIVPRLIAAATGHPPAALPAVPAAGALPRALLHHFGRHPLRLLRALPVARPPAGTGATVPWRPDPAYVSVRSASAPAAVRDWRDRHLPGVSAAAIQFAALAAAFAECGLPAAGPGAVVLVDARRYLPAGRGADGNFAWGLYLRPASLTDPRAIQDELARELSTGSALAMLALRTGRLLVAPGHREAPLPHRVPARPRPRFTFTHLGRLDGYRDLPWAADPARRRNISVPSTSGPDAVTVSLSELAGVLHVNVSFHRSTFDPERVRAATELACAHPAELLHH